MGCQGRRNDSALMICSFLCNRCVVMMKATRSKGVNALVAAIAYVATGAIVGTTFISAADVSCTVLLHIGTTGTKMKRFRTQFGVSYVWRNPVKLLTLTDRGQVQIRYLQPAIKQAVNVNMSTTMMLGSRLRSCNAALSQCAVRGTRVQQLSFTPRLHGRPTQARAAQDSDSGPNELIGEDAATFSLDAQTKDQWTRFFIVLGVVMGVLVRGGSTSPAPASMPTTSGICQ